MSSGTFLHLTRVTSLSVLNCDVSPSVNKVIYYLLLTKINNIWKDFIGSFPEGSREAQCISNAKGEVLGTRLK